MVEDVAYRVIAAQQKPITRLSRASALATRTRWLSCSVRRLGCARRRVGEGRRDRDRRNEGSRERLASLKPRLRAARAGDHQRGGEIDAAEDELYGDARGDELPEHLQTARGVAPPFKRRSASSNASANRTRAPKVRSREAEAPEVKIELDAETIVARQEGRDGWLREARRQLDEHRRRQAKPIAARAPSACWSQSGVFSKTSRSSGTRTRPMSTTARTGGTPKVEGSAAGEANEPPETPAGKINTTDPDSRNVKTPRSYTQGYNTQAVVNEEQIVLAAEVSASSPDFGHLQPMVKATNRELQAIGVTETPRGRPRRLGLLERGADRQRRLKRACPSADPTRRRQADTPRPGWDGGRYSSMRKTLQSDHGGGLYRRRKAMVEPVFAQTKHNRRINQFQRRGASAALSEWRLITATHNLLKLHRRQMALAGA